MSTVIASFAITLVIGSGFYALRWAVRGERTVRLAQDGPPCLWCTTLDNADPPVPCTCADLCAEPWCQAGLKETAQ